jgi:hypothetical protein
MAGRTTKPKEGAAVGRKPTPKPDDPAQSKRFVDAARQAGADEREEAADRAFRKIAQSSKPKSRPGT